MAQQAISKRYTSHILFLSSHTPSLSPGSGPGVPVVATRRSRQRTSTSCGCGRGLNASSSFVIIIRLFTRFPLSSPLVAMQIYALQSLTTYDSDTSCLLKRSATRPAVHLPGLPSVYSPPCAVAADTAFERCGGQAMQSLVLPRPTSYPSAPPGHSSEPEDGLVKFRSKFSPSRPEQQSYPSPPMSEPHSPTHRPIHTSDPSRHSYHAPIGASHRLEGALPFPPPSSALLGHRAGLANHSTQQRQLYPGDSHPRGQPLTYQSGRTLEHSTYGNVQIPQGYGYGYPPAGLPPYSHHAGPMVQQAAMIAPPPARPTKPARRTKAHVASACVNCKKAHLSCDVQRPCGRCVSSGKQVSSPTKALAYVLHR